MDKMQYLIDLEVAAREQQVPVILGEAKDILTAEVARLGPKRILEIGTAVGYSGALMLLHCDGTLDTIEIDHDRHAAASRTFIDLGLTDRVNQYLGDAAVIIDGLTDNKYDFIFMDGPKSKYLAYLNKMLPSINVGGVIFADNVLFRGMVRAEGVPPRKHRTMVRNLRDYLSFVTSDSTLSTEIIDRGDGIAITTKSR